MIGPDFAGRSTAPFSKFDSGWLFIEHLADPAGRYDALTVRRIKSEAATKSRIQGVFSGRRFVYEDSVQIERRDRQIGWAHLIHNPNDDERTCTYAWDRDHVTRQGLRE